MKYTLITFLIVCVGLLIVDFNYPPHVSGLLMIPAAVFFAIAYAFDEEAIMKKRQEELQQTYWKLGRK